MQEWLKLQKSEDRKRYKLTEEMRLAIDRYYFNHYCKTFRSGAFARANSSMYVCLGLCLEGLIIRTILKPYVEHAR
jgi:hypothetical protein